MLSRKDNAGVQAVLGGALPAVLLAVVAWNLTTGWVLAPRRRLFNLEWSNDPSTVTFWVCLKAAAIIALVSWFLLANHQPTEHLAELGVLLAAVVLVGGIVTSVAFAVM